MAAGSEQHAIAIACPTLPPVRQRRTAWRARSGHYILNLDVLSAWLDLITRLGAHSYVSENEEALPFDPLLSQR